MSAWGVAILGINNVIYYILNKNFFYLFVTTKKHKIIKYVSLIFVSSILNSITFFSDKIVNRAGLFIICVRLNLS